MVRRILLPLALFALGVLLLAAVPAPAQYAAPTFWQFDGEQWNLMQGPVQLGAYDPESDTYRHRVGPGWGPAVSEPSFVPEQCQRHRRRPRRPRPHWQTDGVQMPGRGGYQPSNSGLRWGGLQSKAEPLHAPQEGPADPAPTGPRPTLGEIPDYSQMASLTVVSHDPATRARILQDLATAPELAEARSNYPRVKGYDPANFAVKVFQLEKCQEYQTSGVAVIAQPAPGKDGRAPATIISSYQGPAQLAGALRDIDPRFDPNKAKPLPRILPNLQEVPWGDVGVIGGSSAFIVGALLFLRPR